MISKVSNSITNQTHIVYSTSFNSFNFNNTLWYHTAPVGMFRTVDLGILDAYDLMLLVRSPYIPTPDDVSVILKRLGKARIELDGLTLKYKRAKPKIRKTLTKLTQRQRQLKEEIPLLSTLTSPIRNLNDDVLTEIFSRAFISRDYFLSISDFRVNEYPDAWSITEVCSRWRTIAISMPHLWSRIGCNLKLQRKRTTTLCRTWECIEHLFALCLARSCSLPLSLELIIVDFVSPTFLKLLQENSHRWKYITMSVPDGFVAHILPASQSALVDLGLTTWPSSQNGHMAHLPINIGWEQLTRLVLAAHVEYTATMRMLERLSNVVKLELSLTSIMSPRTRSSRTIVLPSLLEFVMSDCHDIDFILDCIILPNLTSLWVRVVFISPDQTCEAILPLLLHSCCPLKRLRITGQIEVFTWIFSIIKQIPSITSLYCVSSALPPNWYHRELQKRITDVLMAKDETSGSFMYLPDLSKIAFNSLDDVATKQSVIKFLHARLVMRQSSLPLEIYLCDHTQHTSSPRRMWRDDSEEYVQKAISLQKCILNVIDSFDSNPFPEDRDFRYEAPYFVETSYCS